MPIAITNTLVNGNVVDAPQLNTNFQDLAQPLNGTEDMDIIIAHTDAVEAPLTVNQKGAGPIAILMQNSVEKIEFKNDGTMEFANTAVNPGMNADRVDGIEGVAIVQTTNRVPFSINFQEADPNTVTFFTEDRDCVIIPEGVNMVVTKLAIKFTAGAHTAGGVIEYTIRRRAANGGGLTDLGNVILNDTNNTIHVVYTNDIADFPLTALDTLTFYQQTRTGTVSERSICISALGKWGFI